MASIRKLNPKDPKSPWVVEYTDPANGKRRRSTPKSGLKKDAEKLRQKIETEIGTGTHVADSETLTVKQVSDLYLKRAEERRKLGQIGAVWYRTMTGMVDNHINPGIGNRPFNELTFNEIEEWYSGVGKQMHHSTARGVLSLFGQIERFAIRRGYTKLQLVREVAKDVGGARRDTIATFSLEQVQNLLQLTLDRPKLSTFRGHDMFKAMVYIAAFCGLRHGEICGLTRESIDFEGGFLRVRHSLTILDEHKGPKTKAGNRDVPMPAIVAQFLQEWLERWYVENDRRLVFRMKNGNPITRANFHLNYWGPLLERAGLPHKSPERLHFHALRHFAASMMIEMGLPLMDVASLLGHEKFDMTLQVYAHPIVGGNRRREAVDRISDALMRQPPIGNATETRLIPISH